MCLKASPWASRVCVCVCVCIAGWLKMPPGTRFLWRTLWSASPPLTTSCTSTWTRANKSGSSRWSATRHAWCTRSRTSEAGASSTCTTTSPPTVWRCSQEASFTWPKVSGLVPWKCQCVWLSRGLLGNDSTSHMIYTSVNFVIVTLWSESLVSILLQYSIFFMT